MQMLDESINYVEVEKRFITTAQKLKKISNKSTYLKTTHVHTTNNNFMVFKLRKYGIRLYHHYFPDSLYH